MCVCVCVCLCVCVCVCVCVQDNVFVSVDVILCLKEISVEILPERKINTDVHFIHHL